MRWLPVLLLLPLNAVAGRAPGEIVEPAIAVDLTPEGLNQLDGLLGGVVPSSIPIPNIVQGDSSGEDCIDLWFDEICWIPWTYALSVTNFGAGIAIDNLDFQLAQDEIAITAVVTVNVSSQASPGEVYFSAKAASVDLFGLEFDVIDIEDTCYVWLPPTPLQVATTLTLALDWPTPDEPVVTVDVAPVGIDFDLGALEITDCFLGDLLDFVDAVNDFIGAVFSFDIYQLLIDAVTPLLNDAVQGVLGDLEATVQGLFTDLVIEQELDLLGAPLAIRLAPSDLSVSPEGIRFAMEGAIGGSGLPHPCVAPYGIDTSLATGRGVPEVGWGPNGVVPHISALVDDDFLNQALFAVWYQGVLCFELSSGGGLPIDLPIPLDTSLLTLLGARDFDVFFPEPQPIALITAPRQPPVGAVDANGDLHITVDQLGLDVYAELDGRMSRMLGMELSADVAAGVGLNASTGLLGVAVDLDADAIGISVPYNELAPTASAGVEAGFKGLFGTLVTPLLGGLLGDLGFELPTIGGQGLAGLTVAGAGVDADWLGVFAQIGPVEYEGSGDLLTGGCEGNAGCGGGCAGGCEGGGCSQGGPNPLLWGVPVLVLLRRRRGGGVA